MLFLGGTFYSVSLLPEPFYTATHLNPVFYMINLVRYGFLGISDVSPWPTLAVLFVITGALFALNVRLFKRGYRLRA